MKDKTKKKLTTILKYAGIAIGGGAIGVLGYKYIFDDTPTPEVKEVCTKIQSSLDYMRGYEDSMTDMMDWCTEHGKSVVLTMSTKGYGEENVERWLVAQAFDTKPEGIADMCNYPYTIKKEEA